MRRVRRAVVLLVVLLGGLLAVPQAVAASACVATALPTPAGTTGYEVAGTDGKGAFVGSVVAEDGDRQGVVWRDGTVTVLEQGFIPEDVNSSGLMGGYADGPSNGRFVAALRPLDGPVRLLTASWSTSVHGVNDNGDAVGWIDLEHPVVSFPAVWFRPDYDDEGFWGPFSSPAVEIDDTGLAMGIATYPDTMDTVWLAEPGNERMIRQYGPETRLYDLDDGVLAAIHNRHVVTIDARSGAETVVRGSLDGVPAEINNGVLVGQAWGFAMLWRAGEGVRLPGLPGATAGEATAVNETGTQVGGISVRADGTRVPTLWSCPPV
jgi:uncharacterized membrane protein